jgi:hypothetical protein
MSTMLERAAAAKQALFQRYDELNALWIDAEDQINQLHIPVSVSHICYSYGQCDELSECLGLQKVKGKWRICHATFHDQFPEDEEWTPIVECSALIRVNFTKYLEGFREKVVRSAEEFIPKVDEAIAMMRKAVNSPQDENLKAMLAERAKLNGKHK